MHKASKIVFALCASRCKGPNEKRPYFPSWRNDRRLLLPLFRNDVTNAWASKSFNGAKSAEEGVTEIN